MRLPSRTISSIPSLPGVARLREEGKSVIDVNAYFQRIEEVARLGKETYDLARIPGLEICNLPEDYHILGIDLKEADQSKSRRDRSH